MQYPIFHNCYNPVRIFRVFFFLCFCKYIYFCVCILFNFFKACQFRNAVHVKKSFCSIYLVSIFYISICMYFFSVWPYRVVLVYLLLWSGLCVKFKWNNVCTCLTYLWTLHCTIILIFSFYSLSLLHLHSRSCTELTQLLELGMDVTWNGKCWRREKKFTKIAFNRWKLNY